MFIRVRFEVANSARRSRGDYLVPVVRPSSLPWRAIRSSFARRLRSPRLRVLGAGVRMELFPAETCRILSSHPPSLRPWRRRGSCDVPAHAMVPLRYPSRLRKSRAELLGNPFPLRLGDGYKGSMKRRALQLVLGRGMTATEWILDSS